VLLSFSPGKFIEIQDMFNSYLADKAMLRLRHLPDTDPVVVLDAFGGSGKVWQCVQANTERKIIRLAIDEKNIPGTLKGDNRKFLPTLDLTKFHVIDLDAYGVPYEQLEIIFKLSDKTINNN